MVFCIGLTGGIGCGKSTVAQLFAELGVTIIDTDDVSHALSQPGSAGFDAIIQRFGPGFRQADGTLDRAKLRTLVFSDADAKRALESILHPMIYANVLEAISLCPAPYVIIVVPLLFETAQYRALSQRSVVVDCPEESQIIRTVKRSGLAESDVRIIMAHQLPRAARLTRADDIIRNENDLGALRTQVAALHVEYLSLTQQPPAKS